VVFPSRSPIIFFCPGFPRFFSSFFSGVGEDISNPPLPFHPAATRSSSFRLPAADKLGLPHVIFELGERWVNCFLPFSSAWIPLRDQKPSFMRVGRFQLCLRKMASLRNRAIFVVPFWWGILVPYRAVPALIFLKQLFLWIASFSCSSCFRRGSSSDLVSWRPSLFVDHVPLRTSERKCSCPFFIRFSPDLHSL